MAQHPPNTLCAALQAGSRGFGSHRLHHHKALVMAYKSVEQRNKLACTLLVAALQRHGEVCGPVHDGHRGPGAWATLPHPHLVGGHLLRCGLFARSPERPSMLVELGPVEQRYQAVREVINHGATVTDVARRYGVARQTVHEWLTSEHCSPRSSVRPNLISSAVGRPLNHAMSSGPRGLSGLSRCRSCQRSC